MNAIEVEEKSCSLTQRTFSPDTTTVSMDNSLYSGQSDAGPRKLLVQVEALEGTEEPVGISHIESTTVIAYKIFSRFIGRMCHPELDSGAIYRACELHPADPGGAALPEQLTGFILVGAIMNPWPRSRLLINFAHPPR